MTDFTLSISELMTALLTRPAATLLIAPRAVVVTVALERVEAIECLLANFAHRRMALMVSDNMFCHSASPLCFFASLVRASNVFVIDNFSVLLLVFHQRKTVNDFLLAFFTFVHISVFEQGRPIKRRVSEWDFVD